MPNKTETRRGVVDNRQDNPKPRADFESAVESYLATAMPWTGIPIVPMGALPRLRMPVVLRRRRQPTGDPAEA